MTMPLNVPGLHIVSPDDDVAVAVRPIEAGERLDTAGTAARESIPRGHKVALRDIRSGENVRKFGWPIGQARRDIPAGARVHTENLATRLKGLDEYRYEPTTGPQALGEPAAEIRSGDDALPRRGPEAESFMGYRRRDGRVGGRLLSAIVPRGPEPVR